MAVDYSMIQGIGSQILVWGIRIVGITLVLGVVYAAAFFINRNKRYSWIVRIFNKDATGNVIQQPDDRGGIFMDKKTSYRLFLLKKNKFGLDPDDIPYLLTSKGKKIVYLLQTGLKNYQFMKPEMGNATIKFNVQDEDVAWAINAWARYKNPYKNTLLQQIMPFIGMAFVFLIVVVALYYMVVKAGFNADLIRNLTDAAVKVSENTARASLGSSVVQ